MLKVGSVMTERHLSCQKRFEDDVGGNVKESKMNGAIIKVIVDLLKAEQLHFSYMQFQAKV